MVRGQDTKHARLSWCTRRVACEDYGNPRKEYAKDEEYKIKLS